MHQDHEEEMILEHRKKKSFLQVIALFIKEYTATLMCWVIPFLILILQVIQVWADTEKIRFTARIIKDCLILILIMYIVLRIRNRIVRKRKASMIEVKEVESTLFVEEEQEAAFIENLEEDGEAAVPAIVEEQGESVIPEDMYIHGDIDTKQNLVIHGNIDGNIYCDGNISLYGFVTGNIRCKNLYVDHTEVEGDIHCDERILFSEESVVIGDVVAWEMIGKGFIEGNVFIKRSVRLEKSAQLIGDVTSMEILVEEGASIQGKILIEAIS